MFKKLLEQFTKMIKEITAFSKLGEQDNYTKEEIKDVFINSAKKRKHDSICKTAITTFIFPPNSWERARDAGFSFKNMLKQVEPNTFYTMYQIAKVMKLHTMTITSLWRPSKNVHGWGIAVDIDYCVSYLQEECRHVRYDLKTKEPKLVKKMRLWLWDSGLINQYISPWKMRGLVGWGPGWYDNKLRNGVEYVHRHHLHLTIRSGR